MKLSRAYLVAPAAFLIVGVASAQEPAVEPRPNESGAGPTLRIIEERPVSSAEPGLEDGEPTIQLRRREGDADMSIRREGTVEGSEVNAQLREMLASFSALFDDVEDELNVTLDEIRLHFEVSAGGQVGFLGTGVSAESAGGITATLRRPQTAP